MSFFRKSKKKTKNTEASEFDAPADNDAFYDEVDNDTSERRRGNFMEEPEGGWKHDSRGMAAGMGVFFTVCVKYVGSMHMPKSISAIHHDAQTDITRECIARVCDTSIPSRVQVRRELSRDASSYPYGEITTHLKNIRLSISATGIVLAPVHNDQAIVAFYPMRNISLATGGEDLDYDFVSFTARHEETKQRQSLVFDCDSESDSVMEALGQAFSLARELQAKRGKNESSLTTGYLDVVPDSARDAMAPPAGAESLYADLESVMQGGLDNPTYGMHEPSQGYMDVRPEPLGGGGGSAGYMDVKPDPIGLAIASQLAQGESLYDKAGGQPIGQAVVDVLNQHDAYMDLAPNPEEGEGGEGEAAGYLELPAWKAYDDVALSTRIPLDELDDAHYDL